jgi:hypothetical protein
VTAVKNVPCKCTGFGLWYVDREDDEPVSVCECGHLDTEHEDDGRRCTGLVWIAAGVTNGGQS